MPVLPAIGKLASFLAHSSSRYSIHSPFLFDLTDKVIRGRGEWTYDPRIKELRKACLASDEVILKRDYGAGSGNDPYVDYPVRVSRIARTSLTPERHARRLFRLASYLQPMTILEIGASLGITTAYLAQANPRSKVVTLEGCPALSRKARENLERLGLSNIEVVTGPFAQTLPGTLGSLGPLGLVYIDGNHRFEATMEYYNQCMANRGNDTVMVFDDIHSNEGMERAWEQICADARATITLDLYFSGWVFFRRESSREHFRLRYL